jgi:hypothetical protein
MSSFIRFFIHRCFTYRFFIHRVEWRCQRGQATTEYALVLLAAALVGLLVIGWATAGGGAAAINSLFDRVIQSVIDKV